jgi:nitrous oxidase accessory protein NosD
MIRFVTARLTVGFLIGSLWLGLMAVPVSAASTIRYVDDNGNQCATSYTSIQAAIDDSNPGDRVYVCPGRYAEQLTLNKNVLVRAWPRFKAHIDVPAVLTVVDDAVAAVRLTADGAKFRGFRVHVQAGTDLSTGLLPACTHVDVAILALGQDNVVRNNKIDVVGDETLNGHCGYDYGIVVGRHEPAGVRPAGTSATSATARITFNWVRDFKFGGILVQEVDSYAFIRRNDIRFYHLNDPLCESPFAVPGAAGLPCESFARPSGINGAFPNTFGIGVETGAEADIIRNAVASGPNAQPGGPVASLPAGGPPGPETARLFHGISLTALDDEESNRVHHNAISRVTIGIHTEEGAAGAEISSNVVTTSFAGLELYGGAGEIHHNRSEFNDYGIVLPGEGGNNVHDNVATDNSTLDCFDTTSGDGTADTDNTWTNNIGNTDQPEVICQPET